LKYFIVTDELNQFNLTGDHKTFWIPGDYDSNEYLYTTSRLSEIDNRDMVAKSTSIAVRIAPDANTVQTPLMMRSADGLYINIHEAALIELSRHAVTCRSKKGYRLTQQPGSGCLRQQSLFTCAIAYPMENHHCE
jgi:hypothetical protein